MPGRVYTLIQYVLRFYVMESLTVAFARKRLQSYNKYLEYTRILRKKSNIFEYFVENLVICTTVRL